MCRLPGLYVVDHEDWSLEDIRSHSRGEPFLGLLHLVNDLPIHMPSWRVTKLYTSAATPEVSPGSASLSSW